MLVEMLELVVGWEEHRYGAVESLATHSLFPNIRLHLNTPYSGSHQRLGQEKYYTRIV